MISTSETIHVNIFNNCQIVNSSRIVSSTHSFCPIWIRLSLWFSQFYLVSRCWLLLLLCDIYVIREVNVFLDSTLSINDFNRLHRMRSGAELMKKSTRYRKTLSIEINWNIYVRIETSPFFRSAHTINYLKGMQIACMSVCMLVHSTYYVHYTITHIRYTYQYFLIFDEKHKEPMFIVFHTCSTLHGLYVNHAIEHKSKEFSKMRGMNQNMQPSNFSNTGDINYLWCVGYFYSDLLQLDMILAQRRMKLLQIQWNRFTENLFRRIGRMKNDLKKRVTRSLMLSTEMAVSFHLLQFMFQLKAEIRKNTTNTQMLCGLRQLHTANYYYWTNWYDQ